MQLFKDRLDKLVDKYYSNKSVASQETETNKDYLYRFFKRDEEEIFGFLRKIILQKKISPEKLYELITGIKTTECKSQTIELPKMYALQTKNYIESLKREVEELKHQREFLEGIVKDALKLKSTIEGHTQQELTSQETPRQNAGTEIVGKKLKRPQTADP